MNCTEVLRPCRYMSTNRMGYALEITSEGLCISWSLWSSRCDLNCATPMIRRPMHVSTSLQTIRTYCRSIPILENLDCIQCPINSILGQNFQRFRSCNTVILYDFCRSKKKKKSILPLRNFSISCLMQHIPSALFLFAFPDTVNFSDNSQ